MDDAEESKGASSEAEDAEAEAETEVEVEVVVCCRGCIRELEEATTSLLSASASLS